MRIIGIIGQKGHGKSALADAIGKSVGRGPETQFVEMAFADPVKACAVAMFQLEHEQLYYPMKEEVDPFWEITPREMFQLIGDSGRALASDIWVRGTMRRIGRLPQHSTVVIADVRYINEANAVIAAGGMLVRIQRPARASGVGDDHSSETEQANIKANVTYRNEGTLEDIAGFARNLDVNYHWFCRKWDLTVSSGPLAVL